MNRKYNFWQSQELLHVDPKTFGRWLIAAKIDPTKQVNRADPRQKWLTEEQIIMLAEEHERPRPSFPNEDEQPKSAASVILTTGDERLAALEQLITQHFDALHRELAEMAQRITAITGNQVAVKTPAVQVAPGASLPKKPTTARKPAKKTTRGKRLPQTMVPLYAFKHVHGVSDKAVEYAMEKGKITVERGKWTRDNKNVMIALAKQGQHEFYDLFHEREEFQRCKDCPHNV